MRTQQSHADVLVDAIRDSGPVSPRDAAKLLRVSWHTAHSLLDGMARDGILIPWRVDESLTLFGEGA